MRTTIRTTIAQAVAAEIAAHSTDDCFELMDAVCDSQFNQHRSVNDDGDVVEFNDGSVYCFDESYGENVCANMVEFMEAVSEFDKMYADNIEESEKLGNEPFIYLKGFLESNAGDRVELSLRLTRVTTLSGAPVWFSTTEWDSEEIDECPMVYNANVAAHIGEHVTVKACTSTYAVDGCSARGACYTYSAPYLCCSKLATSK